jgi:hypothetical protein
VRAVIESITAARAVRAPASLLTAWKRKSPARGRSLSLRMKLGNLGCPIVGFRMARRSERPAGAGLDDRGSSGAVAIGGRLTRAFSAAFAGKEQRKTSAHRRMQGMWGVLGSFTVLH